MVANDYFTATPAYISRTSGDSPLDDDPSVSAVGADSGGTLISERRYWTSHEGLTLQNGRHLDQVQVAYESWGHLNETGDNAILVCHALTGDAHAAGKHSAGETRLGWWDPLIGPGRALDTRRYFVICANVLGGCQGTTGPASRIAGTGRAYGSAFPQVTVRDMVKVQYALLRNLGVRRLAAVVGGSLGGMQVLEWMVTYPGFVDNAIPIGASLAHTAQGIALNMVGREAIMMDPAWNGGDYYDTGRAPDRGLAVARMLGIITYQSDESMDRKFGRRCASDGSNAHEDGGGPFQVENYLHYQGESLVKRFDANSYLVLARAMDLHDVGNGRGGIDAALAKVHPTTRALVIGISSDLLFPTHLQKDTVDRLRAAGRHAEYCEIASPMGHDAFLIEYGQLTAAITNFEF
jgi:homoserine O-acetyltransferase